MSRFLTFILLLGLAGCATKGSKLNLKALKPGQKIMIGNWHINFKKAPPEDFRCEVFANNVFTPIMQINKDPRGYFITAEKTLNFLRVGCLGFDRKWYNYDLKLSPISPDYNSPSIVYYGDLNITIDPDKGLKKPVRKMAGEKRRDADEMMNEKIQGQGEMTLSIVDRFDETTADFEKTYGQELSGHVYARAILKQAKKKIVKKKKKKRSRRRRRRNTRNKR